MTSSTRNLTLTALFAALISVSAFLRIPAGPVPLTMQSAAVLITGFSLGPGRGFSATMLYTVLGLAGLPIFSSGGGPGYVLSPTFGYIIGFNLAAPCMGYLARLQKKPHMIGAYLLMCAGLVCIYLPGLLWLTVSLHWIADVPVNTTSILRMGLLIPLPGDLLTAIPAAVIAMKLRKIIG